MNLELDRTTMVLAETLRDLIETEPERPDPDKHTDHHYTTVARAYEEWDRIRAAYFLILGVRLAHSAMDEFYEWVLGKAQD